MLNPLKPTLLVHPSCPSSRRVVNALLRKDLIDGVNLVNSAHTLDGRLAWSVPMLLDTRGNPLAMDPLSGEDLVDMVLGRYFYTGGDIVEVFVRAVLYSNLASATALVHGSLRPLLDDSFLVPALRSLLGGPSPGEAVGVLEPVLDRVYEDNWEAIARAAALAYVRDRYWASGWSLSPSRLSVVTGDDVATWLLAKASIGRGLLPSKPSRPAAADYIADFVSRRARSLLRMVEKEQAEIYSDEVYLRAVGLV